MLNQNKEEGSWVVFTCGNNGPSCWGGGVAHILVNVWAIFENSFELSQPFENLM